MRHKWKVTTPDKWWPMHDVVTCIHCGTTVKRSEAYRGMGPCIPTKSDKTRVICTSPHESDRECEYKSFENGCTLKGECNWQNFTQNSDSKRMDEK